MHRLTVAPVSGTIRILEVGFGTGLNAALAIDTLLPPGIKLHYITLERFPLSKEVTSRINYDDVVSRISFEAVHNAPWDVATELSGNFIIEKRCCDFLTATLPDNIDVIFMDAFAPDKQPELWTLSVLQRLVATMAPGAVLTTYCAKGVIRRAFAAAGLIVERLAGPPGGKREILRASRPFSN